MNDAEFLKQSISAMEISIWKTMLCLRICRVDYYSLAKHIHKLKSAKELG